ncbi:rRNA pseudouridine synthase [Burkholderiaceae bacterium FT117]|uniref:23S rRNA pseudouridine(2605) synthase RluB n=1 Tax=Zeimonas sediminis TaxID=2944268 RepID=UPI002342D2F2|nr:pseudouridine synthase [Zeimonas sediminis]MCM5569726.1 rRNA pseudouridine synthase [Zeimonas sediminis]
MNTERPRDDFQAGQAADVDARSGEAGGADSAAGAEGGDRGGRPPRSPFNRRRGPRRRGRAGKPREGEQAGAAEGGDASAAPPQAGEARAPAEGDRQAEAGQPARAGGEQSGGPREPGQRRQRRGRGRRPDEERAPRAPADAEPLPVSASGETVGLDAVEGRRRPKQDRTVVLADEDHPKLHKVLADAGLGSRRDMEELIVAGRVSVNGQPAHIGQRIGPNDLVRVNGRPIQRRNVSKPPRVLLYHKPAGEICTRDDPEHRATVFERLPKLKGSRWVAVGRLDFNTEGLLIFTTSGDIANRLMHPRYGWQREYAVRVLGRIDEEARARLLEGVELEDGPAAFSAIEDLGGDGANAWYRVVIAEGRNREVRRMFDAVGLTVSRLARIRFGPVALPRGLARGRWVELAPVDVAELLRLIRAAGGETDAEAERDEDEMPAPGEEMDWDEGYEDPADAIGNRAEPEEERELAPHEIDDDWQPSSSNAHQEGITRQVRSGDGLPGPARGKRVRGVRGRGPVGGFTGPMDHGRPGFGGGFDQPGAGRPGGGKGPKGKPRGGQAGRGGKAAAPGGGKPGRGGARGGAGGGQPGNRASSGQPRGGQPGGQPGGQRRGGRRGGKRGGPGGAGGANGG